MGMLLRRHRKAILEVATEAEEVLEAMTVEELKELAVQKGISIPSRVSKANLVALVRGADNE